MPSSAEAEAIAVEQLREEQRERDEFLLVLACQIRWEKAVARYGRDHIDTYTVQV